MADTPKRYKPSQEQIDQLCRSRNESEAEARAFLESDTRDAKDMLAYLEYEGGQIPPDDLQPQGTSPVTQSPRSHLTPEDLARIDSFQDSEGFMVQGSAGPRDESDENGAQDEPPKRSVIPSLLKAFESVRGFFKHLNFLLRFVAFAAAIAALNWGWQVLGADEYAVAVLLLGAFVLFISVALYGWVGIPGQPRATKLLKGVLALIVMGITLYSAAVFWKKKGVKPWTTLWTPKTAEALDAQSKTATTQSQDDLRAALRADGNRAIRLVTIRVNLKRKYSIDEIGHFRIMYEVAHITDRITPEFYLAGQDYYAVNTFVDPKMKQFGYRWTARYREPNNAYRPIPSFSKGRQYGAATGLTPSTDVLEFSWDLYNQIPSDKILEDLNGKELYIFVTESLVDKISGVSFQVNNWELFSVKADRLIFPDDKPIAPWFMMLSKEEKAIPWKSVNVRFDEPLPPAIASRFKGQNPGWTWSLDFGSLHPKKVPEPELKSDPFKPG